MSLEQLAQCLSSDGGAAQAGTSSQGGSAGDASSAAGGAPSNLGGVCPQAIVASPCLMLDPVYGGSPVSEAVQSGDSCCYTIYSNCLIGRPFSVSGVARTAPASVRNDWCADFATPADAIDANPARSLAQAWRDDALLEHASIASFARFTLELLALGAPPDLVADAQRAGLDEVRHARLCFALASQYGGAPVGPSALDVSGAMAASDLQSVAVRAVEEGCVGETVAALLAAEQAQGAQDEGLRATLAGIAEDEARHAELAWRAVRWAIEQGGEAVKQAVARAFEAALRTRSESVRDGANNRDWRAHGRLTPRESAEARARVLREVVGPCATALLTAAATKERLDARRC